MDEATPDNVVEGNFPQYEDAPIPEGPELEKALAEQPKPEPSIHVNDANPMNTDGVQLTAQILPVSPPEAFIEVIEMPRVIRETVGVKLSTINSVSTAKSLLSALMALFGANPEHPNVAEGMKRLFLLPDDQPLKFAIEAYIPS